MEAADEAGEGQHWIYTGDNEVPHDVTHVRLSDDVTVLRFRTFQRRERLVAVELNEGLVEVGPLAFNDCTSLESVRIPSSVRTSVPVLSVNVPSSIAWRFRRGAALRLS